MKWTVKFEDDGSVYKATRNGCSAYDGLDCLQAVLDAIGEPFNTELKPKGDNKAPIEPWVFDEPPKQPAKKPTKK